MRHFYLKHFGILFLAFSSAISAQSHNWNSPSEVVKKIKKKYAELKAYSADFKIQTTNNKSTVNMKGVCKIKNPGKIRYDFSQPDGDAIVSDGKTLWIYIHKKGAVGKQDLEINKTNSSGEPIFQQNTAAGLNRIFRKYHYKFDSIEQPQKMDGKSYFVLALEQREKIGGFEFMTLYVDSDSYIIQKAKGRDARGKETVIEYSNINLNPDFEDGIFKYSISGNAKIVNNPLVSPPAEKEKKE